MAFGRHAAREYREAILFLIALLAIMLNFVPRNCSGSHAAPPRLKRTLRDYSRRTNWATQLDKSVERKKYSQYGQDGIIEYIFHHIGTTNKYFVEFGFNARDYERGTGANTALLYKHYGWEGLLLDGGNSNPTINLHRHLITPDNILDLFDKYNVPSEPDYVSIDIDSADIWVMRKIIMSGIYRPRVISAEYNSNLPLQSTLAWPINRKGTWDGQTKFYGAALGAFRAAAAESGYSIVWVVPHDVFFVRDDILQGVTATHPFDTWQRCAEIPIHHPARPSDVRQFMEYHTYVRTGNSSAAMLAGQQQMRQMGIDLTR